MIHPVRGIATLLVLIGACGDDGVALPDSPVVDASSDASSRDAADGPPADGPRCPPPTTLAVATESEVTVAGDPGSAMGIFDPSIVYPAGAPGGAVAYSSVPDQHSIRTRIALSGDSGATWTFVGEANVPEAASIPSSDTTDCPTGTCTGALISEVPSLVIDPSEPVAAKRWKLFAHRYLVEGNNTLHYRLGTITVQTAPDPQGPWTAPQKLFGLDSPSPYTTQGAQINASTFPSMADCLVLTEPAALWLPTQLDLAMGCVYLDGTTPRIRIVLARTTDHGQTWSAVGRMLEPGDTDCLPGTTPRASVNAANLFVAPDGLVYLSATSSDTAGYHGCLIYKVDDVPTGHVERDATGNVVPVRAIVTDTGQFSGACSWSAGGGGYQMDVGFLGMPRPFRIFRAGATF